MEARFGESNPLCRDCGAELSYDDSNGRDRETMGGFSVNYFICDKCGEKWELIGAQRLYPSN